MANVYLVWLDISWEISNNVKQAHTVFVIAFPYMFCNIKEIICKCSLNTRAMDLKFNSHLCIIDLKATICDWVVYSWVINNFVKVHAVILVKKQKIITSYIVQCFDSSAGRMWELSPCLTTWFHWLKSGTKDCFAFFAFFVLFYFCCILCIVFQNFTPLAL